MTRSSADDPTWAAATAAAPKTPGTDRTLPVSSPPAIDLGSLSPHALKEDFRYRPVGRLGAGGMGEVRLCKDARIGREVAQKVLHASLNGDGDAQLRFLREARVQGQLEHPAVVPVYDLGISPEGEIYFTMKRIRGVSLEQVLQRLRAGDEEAARKYTRHRLLTAIS